MCSSSQGCSRERQLETHIVRSGRVHRHYDSEWRRGRAWSRPGWRLSPSSWGYTATKLGERTNMKALVATLAITMGVAAPAAAADLDGDDYGNEHYGAVAVAPVAPVAPVAVAPVEPVVVAPVARVYVPPPPVYVAPVARVYAAPYYHRRYLGYGGGWDHAGWGHGGWGHGGWGHGGWRHGGWGRPHW
jgi:hypothetical protein